MQFLAEKPIIEVHNEKDKRNQRRNMYNPVGRPNTIRTKDSLYYHWIHGHMEDDGSNIDECVKIWMDRLSPSTVKSLLHLAKECVKHEKGIELDVKSHLRLVARSKQQKMVTTLSTEEIVSLTAVVKASFPKLYLPYMLGLHCGLRRGEVWGLQWDDIDILNDTITVQRSYRGPTKSGKTRVLPISFALEKALLADMPLKSYNYTGVIKSLFDPNPLLRAAAKKAGVRETNLTFHVLRHTHATLALEAGRSPALVSRQLGHSLVSTTINLYWGSTGETLDMGFLPDE